MLAIGGHQEAVLDVDEWRPVAGPRSLVLVVIERGHNLEHATRPSV
jgi:hypothetical protein